MEPFFQSHRRLVIPIYLFHILVLELVARSIHTLLPGLQNPIILDILISIPLVLLVGYLSYTRIERPLMTFFYKRKAAPAQIPTTAT